MTKFCVICKKENPDIRIRTCGYDCYKKYKETEDFKRRNKISLKLVKAKNKRDKVAEKKGYSHWIKETEKKVRSYCLARDRYYGYPCISCGIHESQIKTSSLRGGAWHAGHFLSVGSCKELRLNTRNINAQCFTCNTMLSSNRPGYGDGIVARFGKDRLDWLTGNHELKKYTLDQLARIRSLANKRKKRYERKTA